jgi:hypothetical protein
MSVDDWMRAMRLSRRQSSPRKLGPIGSGMQPVAGSVLVVVAICVVVVDVVVSVDVVLDGLDVDVDELVVVLDVEDVVVAVVIVVVEVADDVVVDVEPVVVEVVVDAGIVVVVVPGVHGPKPPMASALFVGVGQAGAKLVGAKSPMRVRLKVPPPGVSAVSSTGAALGFGPA